MDILTTAAPPTPWSKNLTEPEIDPTAYVHSFSNLIGEVYVGPNVLIAPGTSIRADEGSPFYIGEATNIQDGVVIHGLEKGRVVGDDRKEYSVWIGKETCITHMALIHGPAYVGDNCFIGFRSTIFNAKIGDGCIVMMHALIQDVEIPAGKYVASGMVITNQQQADRLPDVQASDSEFAHHVVQINEALAAGYRCAADNACINPLKEQLNTAGQHTNGNKQVETMSFNGDVREQVRNLLAQGHKLGTEYADERRFKTKSWLSGSPLQGQREDQIIRELEQILQEHQGEYVRLIGIDPNQKRRVLELTIQRPGDSPALTSAAPTSSSPKASATPVSNGNASEDIGEQVQSFLQQGYQIGLEHADRRRFKTKSWLSGGILTSSRVNQVLQEINANLGQYQGEYVRLVAIDPQAKRRVAETIIQRPDQDAQPITASAPQPSRKTSATSSNAQGLDSETISQVRNLLSQGYTVGTEHADKRRFKTKSWHSCAPIESQRESEVIAALEACLAEHQGEYVRLIGIDPKQKRRVLETIIQRPQDSQTPVVRSESATPTTPTHSYSSSNGNGASSSGGLDSETLSQLRNLISNGYTIGTEHADIRRFKTKSWHSCAPIESQRESEVIAALETCLTEHQGEYVRLIGIDPKQKRRVLETIIQRP